MEKITTVGIDLAKNVFSVHGVDRLGRVVLKKTVSRAKLCEMVAQRRICTIGMEACTGAHEWALRFGALGHTEVDGAQIRRPVPQERTRHWTCKPGLDLPIVAPGHAQQDSCAGTPIASRCAT